MPRMPYMLMAVIDQLHVFRLQGFGQFLLDLVGKAHIFNGSIKGIRLTYSYML